LNNLDHNLNSDPASNAVNLPQSPAQSPLNEDNISISDIKESDAKITSKTDSEIGETDIAKSFQIEDSSLSFDSIEKPFLKESILINKTQSEQDATGQAISKDFLIPSWYFFVLMGALLFVAWVKSNYGSILLKTYNASVNYGVTLRMFKDNSQLQKQLDNILYLIYFISFGVYLQLIASKFSIKPFGVEGLKLYLVCVALLGGLFFVRIVLSGIFGFIFKQQNIFREYRYNIFVFNKLLGILIIPFLFFITYSNDFIKIVFEWISFGVVGTVVMLRIYRGVEFSIKKGVFILYLFLYLCALELIPILVLYKWIQSIV
jgi:hypothetical protein